MKLAFTGPHFSGKSTLAQKLGPILDLEILDFSPATVAANKLGYKRSGEVPNHRLMELQWIGLIEQIKAESKNSSFVSSRSLIDFYAYFKTECKDYHTKHCREYESAILENLNYDLLIFVPPFSDAPPEDNGKRHLTNPKIVENEIVSFLDDWKIPHYKLENTNLQNRIYEILELIAFKND